MKATVDTKIFSDTISFASSITTKRSANPTLECLRVEAIGPQLVVTGSNGSTSIRSSIDQVDVKEGGVALVNASRLNGVIRSITDPTVTIESNDSHQLCVTASTAKFKINGVDPRNWTNIEFLDGDPVAVFSIDNWTRLVSGASLALLKGVSSRLAISGVCFTSHDGKASAVATDGHHLHLLTCSHSTNSINEDLILPGDSVRPFLGVDGDKVKLYSSNNLIMVDDGCTQVLSLKLEGNFPPYRDMISKDEMPNRFTLKSDQLISAMTQASQFQTEDSKGVKMSFDKDDLNISSNVVDVGEASIKVPLVSGNGSAEIGCNPSFLIDAAKCCGEECEISINAPTKPIEVRGGPDFFAIIMGMKL